MKCCFSLWQRMVASVPYVKATEPHLLETYTPEVTQAYITSRLESVAVVVRDGLEDPLDDLGMLGQQLDQLSGGFCLLYTHMLPGFRIFVPTLLSSVTDPGWVKNQDPYPE
jgi:hypothetical protein